MDEKRDNDENPEFDPTKDAFFSDLENIEEEIASEAYELVAHALSLVEDKYYDDAIEVLRQAIGLYVQINKDPEVNALYNKISEIYILKEQNFQEIQKEAESEILTLQIETVDDVKIEDVYKTADKLIIEGVQLVNSAKFDDALKNYREAIILLNKISKTSEIEKVKELLEDCYIRKAEKIKSEEESKFIEPAISESELKVQRIQTFEEAKRKETEYSTQAYELLGKATELTTIHNYDEAIRIYQEGAKLFQEINWL
ncbi:MAG: hypothetical protein ACFFKA_11085, partial [Candidatus Thorarchaeota archaeon]